MKMKNWYNLIMQMYAELLGIGCWTNIRYIPRVWVGRKVQGRNKWTKRMEFVFYLSIWLQVIQKVHLTKVLKSEQYVLSQTLNQQLQGATPILGAIPKYFYLTLTTLSWCPWKPQLPLSDWVWTTCQPFAKALHLDITWTLWVRYY